MGVDQPSLLPLTLLSCFPGDLGGQMGLFIGASILTLLEILDYIYEARDGGLGGEAPLRQAVESGGRGWGKTGHGGAVQPSWWSSTGRKSSSGSSSVS